MKKQFCIVSILYICLLFSGCGPIGDKASSMSIIYGVTSALALLLTACYHASVRKKEFWLQLLFASILVVNIGYFALSISSTLEEALLANRIAYFGSVFLPLSMLMIILRQTKWKQRGWLVGILAAMSICMFIIAASPGYSDIYYSSVQLTTVNGASVLAKEYGPLHSVYLYYLIGYFAAIIAVILHATVKKKMNNQTHVIILAFAVFVNIGVWMLGQIIHLPFEFLSVSYIISGYFILSLELLLQKENTDAPSAIENADSGMAQKDEYSIPNEKAEFFFASLPELTPTERRIYDAYTQGKTTKEVMTELNIKENTLKYHNKNIYSKLGVSSKKELLQTAKKIKLK